MNPAPDKRPNEQDHRLLAVWAADCAEHVLPYFEEKHPNDDRPRKAVEAARAWTRGEIRVGQARTAALAAHAAARDTNDAAARAAGHAAATAHVAGHARAAASYAIKAVKAATGSDAAAESELQHRSLPEHLRPVVFAVRAVAESVSVRRVGSAHRPNASAP